MVLTPNQSLQTQKVTHREVQQEAQPDAHEQQTQDFQSVQEKDHASDVVNFPLTLKIAQDKCYTTYLVEVIPKCSYTCESND